MSTAGESHGPAVTAILEGLPAGVEISRTELQHQMKRRMLGYGRGGRMKIETDEIEITGGIRFGKTIGSPISMLVRNRDFANWEKEMNVWESSTDAKKIVHRPRPGHADLPGGLKYNEHDMRNILERASARETVARTAAGSLCRQFVALTGIEIASHVVSIGEIESTDMNPAWNEIASIQESDRLRCVDPVVEQKMIELIDRAKKEKETLGGIFQVVARNVMPGLGSHIHWDTKLDGRIAQAMMSIHSAKGVAIGEAFHIARQWGSAAHDEIYYDSQKGFHHKTNRAGGTEGGITNGQELRVFVALKPLSTLMKPLRSVDVISKQPEDAVVERSDVCAVPAGGVVGEAMLALVLADALLEKFSSDSVSEFLAAVENYRRNLKEF